MSWLRDRLSTVRGRSAALAAAIVFVALLAGDVAAVVALRQTLTDNLDQTLTQQVDDRANLIDDGVDPTSLSVPLRDEALIWIGRPDGTTVAVGPTIVPAESPVPDELDTVGDALLLVEERGPDRVETERMELRLASASTADGELIVVAGAETEVIDDTIRSVVVLFLVATPLITALVGWLAWMTVGRALRPVDAIRRHTLKVSGTALTERVPVPAGRDEIHDLAVTMNEMLDRVSEHDRARRQFTSDASHELKSPVANLRTLAETHTLDDPRWADLQAQLTAEAERLGDLVDNLLLLATFDDPTAGPPPQRPVDLDDVVAREAELLAATQRVRVDLSHVGPATVLGDERALGRLVRNLAVNAARHAESTVDFSLASDEGRVVLGVGDDGAGIPPEERSRVFERFTRLDSARDRDHGGSGLGLAIADHIVRSHGGSIRADAHRTGGALIVATLPSA